jgi:hypothetical protein
VGRLAFVVTSIWRAEMNENLLLIDSFYETLLDLPYPK